MATKSTHAIRNEWASECVQQWDFIDLAIGNRVCPLRDINSESEWVKEIESEIRLIKK